MVLGVGHLTNWNKKGEVQLRTRERELSATHREEFLHSKQTILLFQSKEEVDPVRAWCYHSHWEPSLYSFKFGSPALWKMSKESRVIRPVLPFWLCWIISPSNKYLPFKYSFRLTDAVGFD